MGESARCWQPTSPGRKLTLGSLRKRRGVLATLTTCRERRPLLPIGEIPPFHEPREHPTSNIERPTSNDGPNWGRWVFDVGCWVLDVPPLRPSTPHISSATALAVISPHCSFRMFSIRLRGRIFCVAKASLTFASATSLRRSASSRMPTILPRADFSKMPALELGGRLAVASVTSALPCSCAARSCRITFGSITLSPATTSTLPSNCIRSSSSAPLRAASPVPSGRSWNA